MHGDKGVPKMMHGNMMHDNMGAHKKIMHCQNH